MGRKRREGPRESLMKAKGGKYTTRKKSRHRRQKVHRPHNFHYYHCFTAACEIIASAGGWGRGGWLLLLAGGMAIIWGTVPKIEGQANNKWKTRRHGQAPTVNITHHCCKFSSGWRWWWRRRSIMAEESKQKESSQRWLKKEAERIAACICCSWVYVYIHTLQLAVYA